MTSCSTFASDVRSSPTRLLAEDYRSRKDCREHAESSIEPRHPSSILCHSSTLLALKHLPAQTASPDETIALGERLARELRPGDVLALYGDLGSGKTHLVKGIAAGLGLDAADAASPTFVLVHEYPTRPPLYHFDAYRIERPAEFAAIGFADYAGADGICVVEWPERIEPLLPPGTIRLRLTALGGDTRRFEEASGSDVQAER